MKPHLSCLALMKVSISVWKATMLGLWMSSIRSITLSLVCCGEVLGTSSGAAMLRAGSAPATQSHSCTLILTHYHGNPGDTPDSGP